MRTIKEVRFELKQWGDFWARQELGQGYSSKSNVQAIKEACQVGCASSSDLHLFSHQLTVFLFLFTFNGLIMIWKD